MTDEDDDESDKHLEARDRRYSCLISPKIGLDYSGIGMGLGQNFLEANLGLGQGNAQIHPYPGITNFDTRHTERGVVTQ